MNGFQKTLHGSVFANLIVKKVQIGRKVITKKNGIGLIFP